MKTIIKIAVPIIALGATIFGVKVLSKDDDIVSPEDSTEEVNEEETEESE